MTSDPSPFELATGELRKLGITLSKLPGEYRVNFSNANDATARTLEPWTRHLPPAALWPQSEPRPTPLKAEARDAGDRDA